MRIYAALAALMTASALFAAAPSAADAPGAAATGKALYLKYGCYQCHGYRAEGFPGPNAFAGPALAPRPLPIEAILRQLRGPRGQMPPYSANVISDQQVADIRAFLATIPAGKDAANIPILAAVNAGNARVPANTARGQDIFSQNCSRCHGISGTEGGAGPSLANEKAKKDLTATITFIKNPAPPMPKLYPSALSEQEVSDVAAYVQSL